MIRKYLPYFALMAAILYVFFTIPLAYAASSDSSGISKPSAPNYAWKPQSAPMTARPVYSQASAPQTPNYAWKSQPVSPIKSVNNHPPGLQTSNYAWKPQSAAPTPAISPINRSTAIQTSNYAWKPKLVTPVASAQDQARPVTPPSQPVEQHPVTPPAEPVTNQSTAPTTPNQPVEQPIPKNTEQHIVSLQNKVIVLDPGHGGSNPGAVENGVNEADINLAVSLELRKNLVEAGANVIMTRETNRTVAPEGKTLGEELQARVDVAETNNADIFISIHSNSNPDPAITGAMSFYAQDKASDLASIIQKSVVQATDAIDKGVEAAAFYVLRKTSMPSTLIEMGFISNLKEAAQLQDRAYRTEIVQGIFNGIVSFFRTK